nr:leukocyte antigen CD37 isoform X2 [Gorilla gorilla gorilla]
MGIALLGCVGALKELRCLLGLYFGMLLLLFATQITLGILISTQRAQLERSLQDVVDKTIQKYGTNPEETAAEESWDYVQFQLRCCGWHSPQDWFQVHILRGNGSEAQRVPCSCYNLSATNDSTILDKVILPQLSRLGQLARSRHSTDICAVPAKSHIYREGCAQSLQKWLHNNLISIVGICLGVGLLEMTVMVLSVQLQRRALRRKCEPHVPGAGDSSTGPSLIADGGGGRSGSLWGGWGMAGACPNWGDKAPQGKLPLALGLWPLWVQDEDQPDTGSAGAELEEEAQLEAEAEGGDR